MTIILHQQSITPEKKICPCVGKSLNSRCCAAAAGVALPSRGRAAPNTEQGGSRKPAKPGWSSRNQSLGIRVSALTSCPRLLPGTLFRSSHSQWGVSELPDLRHTSFGANRERAKGRLFTLGAWWFLGKGNFISLLLSITATESIPNWFYHTFGFLPPKSE